MELHKNTANAFINYLKQHGYPEDRIVTEWRLGNYSVDIVVLDEHRFFPVAMYEVKGVKNKDSVYQGVNQLKTFIKKLGYFVEVGLVFQKPDEPYFEYLHLSGELFDKENQKEDYDDRQNVAPLSYENVKNSALPKRNDEILKKKERKLNGLWIVSWVLAFLSTILLVLENRGCIVFTYERLIVIGSIIVLILLPFFSEIKVGDISFIKDSTNKNKNSER